MSRKPYLRRAQEAIARSPRKGRPISGDGRSNTGRETCIPSELKDQGVNRGVLAILVRITTIPGATIGSRLRRAPYGTDSVDIRLDSVWLPRTRYYGRSPYTVILLAEYIEVGILVYMKL